MTGFVLNAAECQVSGERSMHGLVGCGCLCLEFIGVWYSSEGKKAFGIHHGEKRLTVGVVKRLPMGVDRTDTWRTSSSWSCWTTSPPFIFISAVFHAGLFSTGRETFLPRSTSACSVRLHLPQESSIAGVNFCQSACRLPVPPCRSPRAVSIEITPRPCHFKLSASSDNIHDASSTRCSR
jgi:hypothetical protein